MIYDRMIHDPLCVWWNDGECSCHLIVKVREDAREQAIRDCIEAAQEMIPYEMWDGVDAALWVKKENVVYTLRALLEKP